MKIILRIKQLETSSEKQKLLLFYSDFAQQKYYTILIEFFPSYLELSEQRQEMIHRWGSTS